MANAVKDVNMAATMIAASSTDGSTPVLVKANVGTHEMKIDDDTTGSSLSGNIASRDSNGEAVMMCVSSADGITPVAVYALAASGKLLVNSK